MMEIKKNYLEVLCRHKGGPLVLDVFSYEVNDIKLVSTL